jgi:translation initiation factor IF-2
MDIRLYEIIYRMTEDIEKALKGMLEPKEDVKEVKQGYECGVDYEPTLRM